MALIDGLARMFGGRPRSGKAHDGAGRGVGRRRPVVIELGDNADGPTADTDDALFGPDGRFTEAKLLPPPKSRQEFMHELQRNYAEVLEVVRKVDQHLDEQRTRQERLLEIAERLPAAMDELPKLREQGQRLGAAVDKLTDATLRGQNRQDAAMTKQGATLDAVRDHAARSAEAGGRMADSLAQMGAEMGAGMSQVGEASERLGSALEQLREQETDRNRAVVEAVRRQQRLIVLVAVVAAVSGIATLGTVVLIATGRL